MKLEYYTYYSVVKKSMFDPDGKSKYKTIEDIKKQLPRRVSDQLIRYPDFKTTISVEVGKRDVVAYLDEIMNIKTNDFSKRYNIEIYEDEIGKYEYFFVGLRDLDWRKHIDYDVSRPTCKTIETCPHGAQRTSPTTIRSERIRSLDLAKINDIWELKVRFVVSERLRDIFERNGITGLKYEPCLIERRKGEEGETKSFNEKLYVGEITAAIAQYASNVFLHYYCKKHRIIIAFDICNVVTPREAILESDFQVINRVIVKGKEYYYRTPTFFVSRKVLKILLDNKIADLRKRGTYFGKSFVPVPITE